MEIRIEDLYREVKLCVLDTGDVFEYCYKYYMTTDDYNYEAGEWKCVELSNGTLKTFSMDAKVIKLDTILTLNKEGEET